MADLKYQPVTHDHNEFLKKTKKREGFKKAYEDLEEKYALVREILLLVRESVFHKKLSPR